MRRAVSVVALLWLAFSLAGCWDYVDVERRSLIMGLGIDVDPNDPTKLKLSVEIPVPAAAQPGDNGGGGDMQPKLVASSVARSLMEAGNNLRGELERHPLWDQVVSIVISEQVAREGIGRIADVIMRFNDLNLRAHLYVVEGVDAEEILHYTPNMQPLAARYLRGLAEQFALQPLFPRPQALVIVDRELRDERKSLVPRLTMADGRPRMEGAAVLSDGMFIGWLDTVQSEGVNWIRGDLQRSLLQLECPGHPEGYIAAWVHLDHHRIRTTMADGLPWFRVEISVSARLVDLSRCPLIPENKGDEQKIARTLISKVTDIAETAVRRAQDELQVDILGLGEQWRRNFPALAAERDWDPLFPQASIEIKVDMSPTGIGFPGDIRRTVPYR